MHSLRSDSTKIYGYVVVILIGLSALALALWNGIARGHWFTLGIVTDVIVCITMALLYRAEKRKPRE